MANATSAALALALGAGGGYLVWRARRKAAPGPAPGATSTAPFAETVPPGASPRAPRPAASAAPPPSAAPPSKPWPCSLKLDGSGLTANGQRVDVSTAVARCKATGRAELLVAGDAPAAIEAQLAAELWRAEVPLAIKKAG